MNVDSAVRQLRLVALTALVACTGCAAEAATESKDEPIGSTQQAIINGEDDDADPGVVALLTGGKVYCTGFLITRNVVVTAAHCVNPSPPEQVYFGVNPSSKKGTFIAVTDSKVHPDFDEDTLTNDVAVLGLASKAPVAPVPVLTTPFDSSFKNLPIRLVGFGVTGDGNDNNLRKRSGTTTISSYSDDDFRFKPSPSQTCNGDSGGPALATIGDQEAVIGIASSGDADCATYGRHVRIDSNLDFVQGYTKAYAKNPALTPQPNSGCSMTPRRESGASPVAGLLLVLTFAAAARLITARGSAPSSRRA
jgi:secreted trypsin-like serine protease